MSAVMISPPAADLTLYNNACRALQVAKSTDEVKDMRDKAEAMRAYAHQAKNRQLEIDAAEIRIRAERRLGELIRQQKETVGLNEGGRPPEKTGADMEPVYKPPTLAEAGIDKKLSSHAQKVAAIPEDEFEVIVGEWRETLETANERVTTNILKAAEQAHNHRAQGTGGNEWYTPDEYLDAARSVLGDFDLDPASSEAAQRKVRAAAYFTKDDDGLAQPWHGRVWLNPPYSRPLISHFIDRLCDAVEREEIASAILLTHNYTDTRWFHKAALQADAICFTRGRIKFYSPTGQIAAPTQGQAFFYFGLDVDRFAAEFDDFGFIMVAP
jgi:phage N-6-adenine-methyltransferase